MRRAAILLILLPMLAATSAAGDRFLYPGVYATFGDYSNAVQSVEFAAFLTASDNDFHFLTVGFSDLQIDHADWTYHQQFGVGALTLLRYPYRAKAAYGRAEGRYAAKPFAYEYRDRGELAAVELLRMFGNVRCGASYAYYDLRGNLPQGANNYALRCDIRPAALLSVTAQPGYTKTRDGRSLYALAASAALRLHRRIDLKTGGFAGKRAFYFDHDLLVLHNQTETQTGRVFVRTDVAVTRSLNGMLEFIHSRFDGYHINHFVLGLNARLPLL